MNRLFWLRRARHTHKGIAGGTGGVACLLVAYTALLATLAGCGGSASTPSQSTSVTATAIPTGTPLFAFQPHIGDPASQFVAAYGQPYQQLPEEDVYFADSAHNIAVGVRQSNGKAVHLFIAGDLSWSDQRTFAECALFLPPDAKVYATPVVSTAPSTDFTSSIGEIILTNHGQGACEVYLAGD